MRQKGDVYNHRHTKSRIISEGLYPPDVPEEAIARYHRAGQSEVYRLDDLEWENISVGDEDAIREGCDWVRHFEQLDPKRRLVYNCIETLLKLDDPAPYRPALQQLYGSAALQQAEALLSGEERFFGVQAPGLSLAGCDMHQRLLAAYDKLHARGA